MLSGGWVALRQYRFEVGACVAVALVAATLGLSIAFRMNALGVSPSCLESVRASQDGSGVDGECYALVQEGSGILGETYLQGEGTIQASIMGVLPFLIGLLAGVPIVAREIEGGTAQTAWWLFGSRTRWLFHQIAPVALTVGIALGIAAISAIPVAEDWTAFGRGGAWSLIGLHGPLAVVRAFGAFGVGVVAGALFGRSLPAFICGGALMVLLLFAVGQARELWVHGLPPAVVATYSPETGEWNGIPSSDGTGWGWLTPAGRLLSQAEARRLATDAGVPPSDPSDAQDTAAVAWLTAHGYTGVPVGITDEMAMGWAPFDGAIFGTLGVIGLGSTVVLIQRRRPI